MEKQMSFTISPYYMDIVTKMKNHILSFQQEPSEKRIEDFIISNKTFKNSKLTRANTDYDMAVSNIKISIFAYFKVFEKRFAEYYFIAIIHKLVYYFRDYFLFQNEIFFRLL